MLALAAGPVTTNVGFPTIQHTPAGVASASTTLSILLSAKLVTHHVDGGRQGWYC